MYLWIFVFTFLTASVLGLNNEDEGFKCPVCNARGENAKAKCDANIVLEDCKRENAICEITKYSFGTVIRQCSDINTYKTSVSYCKKRNNCEKGKCKESGCMAEIIPVVAGSEEAFSCPVCSGNSLEACDKNVTDKECKSDDPVCVLRRTTDEGEISYGRQCYNRDVYNRAKDYCATYPAECSMAMCDKSGCKAEWASSARSEEAFSCPVCFANSLEACDEKLEHEECREDDPVCMLGWATLRGRTIYQRFCYSRGDYNEAKDDCDREQICDVAMCDQSGCKAELANSA